MAVSVIWLFVGSCA